MWKLESKNVYGFVLTNATPSTFNPNLPYCVLTLPLNVTPPLIYNSNPLPLTKLIDDEYSGFITNSIDCGFVLPLQLAVI